MADPFRFKQFSVNQSGCAMKINTDAVLLGALAQAENPQNILDIGTGTGILALVALKYGASDVLGIDIGPLSVQAARDNMKANRSSFDVLKADIKKYRSKKTYDLVAANLITEDLIEHSARIVSFVKEGGLLAVSGISLGNLAKLRKSFSSLPLKCIKISRGQQWTGLLYQKRMS